MKSTFVLAAVLAAGLVPHAALAADIGTYDSQVYPASTYVPIDPWTGLYVGVHGGFTPREVPNVFNGAGWNGGVQVGYNFAVGPGVIGAELEGSYSGGTNYKLGNSGGELGQTWTGAAKLRGGIAFDQTLLYGTLGYGAARLDPKGAVTSPAQWASGFVFGGGVEQSFGNGLSARLEYTQMRLNSVATTVGGVNRTDDLVNHAIKAGLNFRF